MLPLVTVLCPTYKRPQLLANAIACFQASNYPAERRRMLIFDDANQIAPQSKNGWEVRRYRQRFPSLPHKYNAMVAASDPQTDIYVLFDDDDVYLPHHISAHVKSILNGQSGWSKPSQIRSTYTGQPEIEPAHGLDVFHGSIAVSRAVLTRVGGWPVTPPGEPPDPAYDLKFMASLALFRGPPANPLKFAPPQYVFRWGSTGTCHYQDAVTQPPNPHWYDTLAANVPAVAEGRIVPAFDAETKSLYAQFAPAVAIQWSDFDHGIAPQLPASNEAQNRTPQSWRHLANAVGARVRPA